jgi:hypothetical protein
MSSYITYLTLEKFIWVQSNLSFDLIQKIFNDENNSNKHLHSKWLQCDYNIVKFISLLDDENKQKLIDLMNKKI